MAARFATVAALTQKALRELRDAVRANPEAAAFLLSILSTASEAVIQKPLAEMLHLPETFSAPSFDDVWMSGRMSKSDLAAALAVLLGDAQPPLRGGWNTVAGSGTGQPPGRLVRDQTGL